MSKPDIETLTSKVVYRNRWMTVREDQVRRRDGSEGIYGVVEKANFVAIAAIQDGRIHLVEQYRYPVRQRFWELPQGAWHDAPDTDAETVARGELREETGLTAGEMIYAGEFCLAYGFSDHRCRLSYEPSRQRLSIGAKTHHPPVKGWRHCQDQPANQQQGRHQDDDQQKPSTADLPAGGRPDGLLWPVRPFGGCRHCHHVVLPNRPSRTETA